MIPYGGYIYDFFGVNVLDNFSLEFFTKFCNQMLKDRMSNASGRKSDFVNLMGIVFQSIPEYIGD